jgi:hypothetical protein
VAIPERTGGRPPCRSAFVTGSADLVADVTPALEREGFATRSAAPHELEGIRAAVPARSLDCYVQLPTTDIEKHGLASVPALRALVADISPDFSFAEGRQELLCLATELDPANGAGP